WLPLRWRAPVTGVSVAIRDQVTPPSRVDHMSLRPGAPSPWVLSTAAHPTTGLAKLTEASENGVTGRGIRPDTTPPSAATRVTVKGWSFGALIDQTCEG